MNDNALLVWIIIVISIFPLTFCGEPDIHDVIIHKLMDDCEIKNE